MPDGTGMGRGLLRLLAWCALLLPAAAMAAQQPEWLCSGQSAVAGPDGRVLGHIAYPEASAGDLVPAPAGFGVGNPCFVHRDMLPDLYRLLSAAAATPGVGPTIKGISCFRSIEHQRQVFCSQIGPGRRCRDAAERARSVGPPGHSEHATGYAIDFGVRPQRCPDVNPCIAATAAGRWLLAHGPDYGFELSFPPQNAQGVTWEPWHWRWVGTSMWVAGAMRARALFATARERFPAAPAVVDVPPDHMPGVVIPPAVTLPPPQPLLPPDLPYPSPGPYPTPAPSPSPAPYPGFSSPFGRPSGY